MSVRSTAMRPRRLSGLPAARRALGFCKRHRARVVLDRGFAIGADLPQRLERPVAVHARLPQLGRAHGTDQKVLLDLGAAHGTVEVARAQALLDRLDLELALADVLEVLGRP